MQQFSLTNLAKGFLKSFLAFSLSLLILISPFGETAEAGRSLMTGDYVNDTISVAQGLKEAIENSDETKTEDQVKDDALQLITDYISRYRNRPQVNGSVSFTTMQTALNAMAGHYKTFANRPLPEKLKERLNKELSRAEKIVTKEL